MHYGVLLGKCWWSSSQKHPQASNRALSMRLGSINHARQALAIALHTLKRCAQQGSLLEHCHIASQWVVQKAVWHSAPTQRRFSGRCFQNSGHAHRSNNGYLSQLCMGQRHIAHCFSRLERLMLCQSPNQPMVTVVRNPNHRRPAGQRH